MNDSLSNLLNENRTFAPSPEFVAQANAKADMYDEAERDRLAFWRNKLRYYIGIKSGLKF